MIVKNPTSSDLAIQYKGFDYSVKANGEVEVPDEAAKYWQEKIHNFLVLSTKKTEVVEEAPVIAAPVEQPAVVTSDPVAPTAETSEVVKPTDLVATLGAAKKVAKK